MNLDGQEGNSKDSEPEREFITYSYTRKTHLVHRLNLLKGNDDVPDYILERIQRGLGSRRANYENVQQILKMWNLKKYYEKIPSILSHFQKTLVPVQEKIECPICLEDAEQCISLDCKHLLCVTCAKKIIEGQSEAKRSEAKRRTQIA